jgi:hypothetical protein
VHDGPADVPPAWAPGGLPGHLSDLLTDTEVHDHDAGHDAAHRAPRPVGSAGHPGPLSTVDWPADRRPGPRAGG